MVTPAAERAEFAEIPAGVRELLETRIRNEAFEILHAEAVERGDLGPPPATYFDRLPGRLVMVLFAILFGVFVGSLSVIIVLYSIRGLATVL